MKNLFITGVFLVTIITTVSPNKNVTKELQNSNVTANKNGTSLNKIIIKEKYDGYVDPEVQKIWEMYLAKSLDHNIGRTLKWTTAMGKESAVTEKIKAFRERGINIGKQAASNITLSPTPGARPHEIGNVHDVRRGGMMTPMTEPTIVIAEDKRPRVKVDSFRQLYWSPTGTGPTTKEAYPTLYRACDPDYCNFYFKTYGNVCGHRYDMIKFKYEFKNFKDICELDRANCQNNRPGWHPAYRGKCGELLDFVPQPVYRDPVVTRGLKLARYTFKRRTATPSPADDELIDQEELKRLQKMHG